MDTLELSGVGINGLPSYTVVELPIITNTLSTAVSFLGGDEEPLVFTVKSNASILPLKIPGSNPFSAPFIGNRDETCGLLLKVVRNRRSKECLRVEAVGKVESKYSFNKQADYQVLL